MKRSSPGRPPLDDDDESVDVHLTLTATQYDATYRRAQRARVNVQDIIRRDITRADPPPNKKP